MILAPINTTAPTDAWTMIKLPAGQDCEDYAVQGRGSFNVLISRESDGDTYYTVKADTIVSLNEALGPGAAFFYAKSVGTETIVEVLPLRRHRGK